MLHHILQRPIEILLVEDSDADIRLFQEAFLDADTNSSLDHNISIIKDGSKVMSYLYEKQNSKKEILPDIILLDINLPRKNGLDILKEIKLDDKLRSLPVIILSTSNSTKDINEAYDNYANSYIIKPMDFDTFIKVVKGIESYWVTIAELPKTKL